MSTQTLLKVHRILNKYKNESSALIPILQDLHNEFGYLSEDIFKIVAKLLNVPLSRIYSIVTFYPQFRLKIAKK